VQELHLFHVAGTDGGFLAAASPTLRSLHLERLPDFKARMLPLVKTRSTTLQGHD
jgi:hypothetical protein